MLRPPTDRTRERILVYGASGVGKSRAALSVARRAHTSGSDARFHVIDSDFAWDRMLETADPGNIDVYPVFDWDEYRAALAKIEGQVRPQDWVVVDMIGTAWEAVQTDFISKIHGMDEGDYYMSVRKELSDKAKNLGALSGWLDWPVVNKHYKTWFNRLALRMPCHVLAISTSERVNADTDEKAVRDLFGPLGGKPGGQKHLPHAFHTVLLFGRSGGNWVFSTAKERGERPTFDRSPISDFSLQYLFKVGWRF